MAHASPDHDGRLSFFSPQQDFDAQESREEAQGGTQQRQPRAHPQSCSRLWQVSSLPPMAAIDNSGTPPLPPPPPPPEAEREGAEDLDEATAAWLAMLRPDEPVAPPPPAPKPKAKKAARKPSQKQQQQQQEEEQDEATKAWMGMLRAGDQRIFLLRGQHIRSHTHTHTRSRSLSSTCFFRLVYLVIHWLCIMSVCSCHRLGFKAEGRRKGSRKAVRWASTGRCGTLRCGHICR